MHLAALVSKPVTSPLAAQPNSLKLLCLLSFLLKPLLRRLGLPFVSFFRTPCSAVKLDCAIELSLLRLRKRGLASRLVCGFGLLDGLRAIWRRCRRHTWRYTKIIQLYSCERWFAGEEMKSTSTRLTCRIRAGAPLKRMPPVVVEVVDGRAYSTAPLLRRNELLSRPRQQ